MTRCLEIISEAARRIDQAVLDRHPHLPWSAIKGAGNVYRHEYDEVLPRFLWQTVTTSLPPLIAMAEQELEQAGPC